MLMVVIALLPASAFGIYNFGVPALIMLISTTASAVLTEYIYEKKLNLKDDENILWEINRYDEYDSKLSTDNNEFVNKTLNENFLELATYVQHFGYGDNEIDESKIFTKKIDFDAWMNCYSNTKIDFENLLIPGFEKIKKILEEF